MAASLTLASHGRALRLAAELTGEHFQGLGALAARLRRSGCQSKASLRRLADLDKAAGVVRHITSASVAQLDRDLAAALKSSLSGQGGLHRYTSNGRIWLPRTAKSATTIRKIVRPTPL